MADTNQAAAPAPEVKPDAQPAASGQDNAAAEVNAAKAVETKPSEVQPKPETKEGANKPVVPEKYDLKIPEGSPIEASVVEEIASYAKEQGFSNEQAQKLLDREHKALARFVEGQNEQLQKSAEVWKNQVMSDKEIGLDGIKAAQTFIKTFASPELIETLEKTGLGNHPELVRMAAKAGRLMANDKLVTGANATGQKKSMEQVFYGSGE